MATKAEYKKWIWQYKRRRETFVKRQKALSAKIKIWKRQVKRMEDREKKVSALGGYIYSFMGYSVRNSGGNRRMPIEMRNSRGIFYKYGLENGIAGNLLREYTKDSAPGTPGRVRRWFNRKFQSNPSLREQYQAFCNYIQEEIN